MEMFLRVGLDALGELVEDVGGLGVPSSVAVASKGRPV